MVTRIQKWGNSLGLRIPRSLARQARVESGCEVKLTVQRGKLMVSAVRTSTIRLKSLLSKVTADNIHREVPTGRRGREAW